MPKKPAKIRTISYIPTTPDGGNLICLDDMTPEQRDYTGAMLSLKILNSQYAGQAEFFIDEMPKPDDVFQVASGTNRAVNV